MVFLPLSLLSFFQLRGRNLDNLALYTYKALHGLEQDIITVMQQLENMKKEMASIDQAITMHTGGMSTIEVMTSNGFAIVKHDGETPLAINQFQVTQAVQQMATEQQPVHQNPAPPNQYSNPPTQTAYTPQPPITPEAQQHFAPNQMDLTPME